MDFSSAPSVKKPITVAIGFLSTGDEPVYHLQQVFPLPTLPLFEKFLATPGLWLAGFDLPFSLPRPLIEHYQWPDQWPDFIDWYSQQPRESLRLAFKDFCAGRPAGHKFVYRKTDRPAGSSPAMRWTNPPVAWMLHAGAWRLKAAGICLPGLARGSDSPSMRRYGFEAYPGFTARQVSRASYKSDQTSKHTPERRQVRQQILEALCSGQTNLSVRLHTPADWASRMIDDGSGDLIDAVICALQAAHAFILPDYGLPADLDPLEGWIASVPRQP